MSALELQARALAAQARARALSARQAAWFQYGARAGVMSAPPSVTTGVSSSMASPFFYPAGSFSGSYGMASSVSDRFAYSRGQPAATPSAAGVAFDNVTTNAAGTSFSACSFGASFIHHGSVLELVFSQNSTGYLVKVDDQYVTLTVQPVGSTGGAQFFAKYDFGAVARRRIDVIGGNSSFAGVNVGANDSLDPAPIRGPRVIVVGDSFTQQPLGWVTALSDQMGWDDVWASGVGGTGYLATGSGARNFRQRVTRDVIAYAPDVVIVCCWGNDNLSTGAQVGAEAALLYAQLRSSLPNALIFAGPEGNGGVNRYSANMLDIKDATRAAALAADVAWIDPIEMPLTLYGPGTTISGTVLTGYSAGTAGTSGISLSGGAGTNVNPQAGCVIEIGSGATRERIQVKAYSQVATGVIKVYFDGALQYAHIANEPWKMVGGCYLTGKGYAGATTGFGNADLYVSSDGTHPSAEGAVAMGRVWSALMRQAMRVAS